MVIANDLSVFYKNTSGYKYGAVLKTTNQSSPTVSLCDLMRQEQQLLLDVKLLVNVCSPCRAGAHQIVPKSKEMLSAPPI